MSDDPAIALPVLPSLNIAETQAYYRGSLGFRELVYGTVDYLVVRRGKLELHFWLTDNASLPAASSVYIRGGEILALYEEFRRRPVATLSEFTVRPWNMKEFYVHDPHGNLLKFGCAPDEIG